MKVVVSIGGSVLVPDLDPERVREYASVIERLADEDATVGTVVGGGTVARDYIGAARDLGADEIWLDGIGIAATRLNARLLLSAIDDGRVARRVPEDYETAAELLRQGDLCVMGGAIAGQTTDAVSAALAEFVDADLLVYATSVPGVFSADPESDPDAEGYDELSPSELLDVIGDIEMSAGSSAPVDILAAKLIERSGMRAVVLDGTDPQSIENAVLRGDHDGTDIVPSSADDPTAWW
jgi:uridylate kinase